MNKPLKIISLFLLVALSCFHSHGQNYPVKVQVQLVQPFYPYLSDYKQKSIISFTNTVDVPMDIYIQAKLENDRGQMIKTAPNQYSRIPIHLPSLQTAVVQGYQLDSSFFDLHNLQTNLDDQTKAKLYQFGMIPEGFYSYCVTAFRIDGNGNYEPVSDPNSSCAFVNIGYVQPPQILSPLPNDHIVPGPLQNVSITWTRPVGNLQGAALTYDLYLVKVLTGEDPALAMSNAVQYGAGIFMKQENIPATVYRFTNLTSFQLEEGSEYALMVQARDINGKAAFLNNGRSEVSVFGYGDQYLTGANDGNTSDQSGNDKDRVVVKGRLQWAFKNTENETVYQSSSLKKTSDVAEKYADPFTSAYTAIGNPQINATTAVAKPFYQYNTALMASTDPSALFLLSKNTASTSQKIDVNDELPISQNAKAGMSLNTDIINYIIQLLPDFTATVADSIHSENTVIQTDTGSQRFALSGVNLTLSATPANDPQKKTFLATGITDNEGKFAIHFLDPAYQNIGNYSRLIVSVQANDFENTVFEIPIPGGNIPGQLDIGTKVLLARTWRFFPEITFENSDAADAKDAVLHIYRETSDYKSRSWLTEEGRPAGKERKKMVVDGKEVFEIASLNFNEKDQQPNPLQIMTRINSGEGIGRLFLGGKLLVKIIPATPSYYEITSVVTVIDKSLPAYQVLTGKAMYKLKTRPSHIEGNISLFLQEQTSVPVSGATVRIMYQKADVVESPVDFYDKDRLSASVTTQLGSYTGTQLTANNMGKVTASFTGIIPALMIAPDNSGNNQPSELIYSVKPVVASVTDNPSPVCDGCSYKTAYTDETGNYYSANLPVLRQGASFTVEVIKLPNEFSKFEIRNKGGGVYPSVISLGKGVSKKVDFTLDAEVVDIGGRVVDKEGKALTGVRLVFKGNTLTTSGTDGLFVFKLYPGNHLITLEKEGYIRKQVSINIPVSGNKDTGDPQWLSLSIPERNLATLNRIKAIPTVQSALSAGYVFSPALFGLSGSNGSSQAVPGMTAYNASIAAAFGMNTAAYLNTQYEYPRVSAMDMKDIGYLEKITGKIRFTVRDKETDKPVADVQIKLFDTTHLTDADGQWYYEGSGGAAIVTVKPPASSGYAAEQRSMTLPENGRVQDVVILLEKGIRVTGQVTSGNTPLINAQVFADGEDLSASTTDNTGHYTLYLKKGMHDLSVRMQNYVGQDLAQRSVLGDGTVYNFDLKGGNGRNYGSLLGFDIELSTVAASGSEEIWSGNFIHLKPVDPTVFVLSEKTEIPFSNVRVRFDTDGKASPVNNKVETDVTNIPVKIFGFLPAVFANGNVVTITDNGSNKGQLKGKVSISFGAIQGYRGWKASGEAKVMITRTDAAPGDMTFIQAGTAASAGNGSWALVTETGKPFDAELYGFKIHLNSNAAVRESGLEFSGTISTPALPVIRSVAIGIKNLGINKGLAVSGVQIATDDLPALDIAGWQASFGDIIFNEDGFKIGGKLAVAIPSSGKSEIDFSDLSIAKDEIFGGKFLISGSGINLLSVANLNSGGDPLSFGRVGSSTVYRIGGKASLRINLSIFSNEFKIPTFELLTNGTFNLQAPVGYSTSLGPFGFSVGNLYINTAGSAPYIGIQGNFKTDLGFLKFEVADIKVRAGAGGPTYTIEKVGVTLDVPVVKVSASVAFRENGFEGEGVLSIPATPVSGSVSFRYFKTGGSVDLGAHFSANIPPVPIGAIVTLDRVGGGFDYVNGNFSVDVNGKLSLVGTGAVVALDPVGLTVSSRGILKGYGDVTVGSYLKTSHAETIFNGPERTFTVQVSAQMSPVKGLVQQQVKGALVISAKPNDEFAFLGCSVLVQIAGLVNNHGEMAVAVGLKNPKNHDDITAHYFQYAPDEYMQSAFSGVYINVAVQLGIPRDNAVGFDITIASARLWCSTAFQASLILNFAEDAYRIKFGGKFDAGIEGCVGGIACVSLSAGLCYIVEGGRNDTDGWNFNAAATGHLEFGSGAGIGNCDPSCNEVVTAWDGCAGGAFRVCAGVALDFGFSQRQGLGFNVRAGGNYAPCF